MKAKIILFLFLGIDACILFYEATQLSISASEASILYGSFSFLQIITQFFLTIFGHNDISLRFFMIILHLLSALLLYAISKSYIKDARNRLWLIVIFLLLPGSISSALVISHASIIIFGLFIYIYLLEKLEKKYLHILLLLYLFIEPGFAYLFLSLGFYYLYKKELRESFYYLFLYSLSLLLYGFVAHGIPSGHFLDILGVYSAIFSPFIFIYLFYTLYREFLRKHLNQIWFIATTALIVSIVLSFRQRINLEYFAPYLMIVLPLAAQIFIHSYRIRLRIFRKRYKFIFIIAFVFLVVNALIVFFHKEFYFILSNPKKHFAYNMDIASPLAKKLKKINIRCITVENDKDMQLRLQFYGIDKCSGYMMQEVSFQDEKNVTVTICYKNKILYKANVTKLNNDEMKLERKEKAFSDIK